MHRRFLLAVLVAAIAIAFALPGSALALRVHVRVEGATTTIFGATNPLLAPYTGSIPVDGAAPIDQRGFTALGALEAASRQGEFYYKLTSTSIGPYVSQIGRNPGSDATGWVYKVNGVSPSVGADASLVKEGDDVLWYYATFTDAGGPPTLDLVRAGARCFRAYAVDDAGKRTPAAGVVYRLDSKSIRSASGRICPTGRWGALRATREGAVRSQLVLR
jgi:Domain of unknown function (DUF4430)